jgi:5-methylcytosine-specific restriction endonuclease McrA
VRTCNKCGESLPETAEFFHRQGSGLRPDCKACVKQRSAAYYVKNRERIAENGRAWRAANPEKCRDAARRYRSKHRDRLVEYQRTWRKQNLDKAAGYMRTWRLRHRDRANAIDRAYRERTRDRRIQQAAEWRAADRIRYRAYQSKRRTIIRKSDGKFTTADIAHLHQVQGGRCRWCSVALTDRYEIDHVLPLSRGGSNQRDNLALTCPTCNRRKSNLLVFEEWTPPHPIAL